MKAFRVFKSEHQDLIHDVAFDYYGRRIASCSSDGTIRIWDQVVQDTSAITSSSGSLPISGDWRASESIKAHLGTIHRVVWAHPEFGQVIASCGSDNEVCIFEERNDGWKRHVVGHAKDAVVCVEFAPSHLGLKLATASLDGRVRIYSCSDGSLATWTAPQILEVAQSDAYCLAWSPSPFENPALAVGARDRVRIYNLYEEHNRWAFSADLPGHQGAVYDVAWAPGMGRSYHLIATACADSCVRIFKYWPYGRAASNVGEGASTFAALGSNLLEAISPSCEDILLDALTQPQSQTMSDPDAEGDKSRAFTRGTAVCVATLSAHGSRVRRVQWNLTATTLASSADDGTVRLWAEDLDGVWRQVMIASGENSGREYATNDDDEQGAAEMKTQSTKSIQSQQKPAFGLAAATFGSKPSQQQPQQQTASTGTTTTASAPAATSGFSKSLGFGSGLQTKTQTAPPQAAAEPEQTPQTVSTTSSAPAFTGSLGTAASTATAPQTATTRPFGGAFKKTPFGVSTLTASSSTSTSTAPAPAPAPATASVPTMEAPASTATQSAQPGDEQSSTSPTESAAAKPALGFSRGRAAFSRLGPFK